MSELTTFIPAGGLGTRLSPHTLEIPKPLLVMGDGKRIIDHPIELCSSESAQTWVSTDYLAETVEEYLFNYPNIKILRDRSTIGSGGSLVAHYDKISSICSEGDLLVLPSDHIYEGVSISDMWVIHKEENADITLLTVPNKEYGEYVKNVNGVPVEILKEPREDSLSTTGIFMFRNKYVLDLVRKARLNGNSSLNIYRDMVCSAVGRAVIAQYFIDSDQGFWEDTGTISRYHSSNMRLSRGANVILDSVEIDPNAKLSETVVQGKNVKIDSDFNSRKMLITGLDNGELVITRL